jgi:hypothetical protein
MYNHGMFEVINQTTNWATADIRILLVDSAYVFDPDDNFVSDVSASEISTTNYVRQVLDNATITEDDAGDSVVLDGDDEVWTALGPPTGGPTIGGAVLYRNTGADGTSPVITFGDLTDTIVNGGDITVVWPTAGIVVTTSP